jgi:hypothetical protein
VVFVGMSPRQMMGRGQVQLMKDDGIDAHVPATWRWYVAVLPFPHTCHHNPSIHAANTNGHTSIVFNANSNGLLASGPGFFVNPVQSLGVGSANLAYNADTKEIYVASSSRRYKTDIEEVNASESARVWNLRPVSYRDIHKANDDNSPVYYGFIAEEVAEVDPRLCFWGPDADGLPQVEGVNYDQVVPLLLQEAKQLKAEITALQARNAEMEKKVEFLFAEYQQLTVGPNRF